MNNILQRTTTSIAESIFGAIFIVALLTPPAFLWHNAADINELLRAECERVLPMVAECFQAEIAQELQDRADMTVSEK